MSGAAKGRGGQRGRGLGQTSESSDTSSRRGDRLAPPGAFDGPASRGTASGTGGSQRGSTRGSPNPPQGGFAPQAPSAPSRASSVSAPQSQVAVAPRPVVTGDPARERPDRVTDAVRNVDLPASGYNIDNMVSAIFHIF